IRSSAITPQSPLRCLDGQPCGHQSVVHAELEGPDAVRSWKLRFVPWLALVSAACGSGPPASCPTACPPSPWSRLEVVAGQPAGPGWVDGPRATAHFLHLQAGVLDPAGHLYLLDGNAVRAIDLATDTVTTVAGIPNTNGGTDGIGDA